MRAEAGRDRLDAAAKRSDANEDDNSAGLVLDTDFVARLIKRLSEFGDLRPSGTCVRQGNRLLCRNDRAVLQHFEIVDTHTPTLSSRGTAASQSNWQLVGGHPGPLHAPPESFTKPRLRPDEGFV